MKVTYVVVLLVLLSVAVSEARLFLPKMNESKIDLPAETEKTANVCHKSLLKAAWKLFAIVRHWTTNWLLLFGDAKDIYALIKEVIWNCFLGH